MDYLKINVLVVSEAKECVCAKTHSHKGTSDTHKYKYKCKRNGICPNKSTENGILWVFRIRRNLYTFATQHRERERVVYFVKITLKLMLHFNVMGSRIHSVALSLSRLCKHISIPNHLPFSI